MTLIRSMLLEWKDMQSLPSDLLIYLISTCLPESRYIRCLEAISKTMLAASRFRTHLFLDVIRPEGSVLLRYPKLRYVMGAIGSLALPLELNRLPLTFLEIDQIGGISVGLSKLFWPDQPFPIILHGVGFTISYYKGRISLTGKLYNHWEVVFSLMKPHCIYHIRYRSDKSHFIIPSLKLGQKTLPIIVKAWSNALVFNRGMAVFGCDKLIIDYRLDHPSRDKFEGIIRGYSDFEIEFMKL